MTNLGSATFKILDTRLTRHIPGASAPELLCQAGTDEADENGHKCVDDVPRGKLFIHTAGHPTEPDGLMRMFLIRRIHQVCR